MSEAGVRRTLLSVPPRGGPQQSLLVFAGVFGVVVVIVKHRRVGSEDQRPGTSSRKAGTTAQNVKNSP